MKLKETVKLINFNYASVSSVKHKKKKKKRNESHQAFVLVALLISTNK